MGEKVVIFGVTEQAVLAYFSLTHESPHQVVAFTVDRCYLKEKLFNGLPVVAFEDVENVYPPSQYKMHVATLYSNVNSTRAEKYCQAKAKGYELLTHVSPRAVTWPDMVVGDNCFICAGACFQPLVEIGNNVIIGPGSVICHDVKIGDHCFLTANAVVLGGAVVEPYCFLGANSTVRNDITVAKGCVIGAGALILADTLAGEVHKGRVAELLAKRSNELNPGLK